MEEAEHKRRLIDNKRDAVIALCLTGIVTALIVRAAVFRSLRGASSHSQHGLPWLFDMRFMLSARAAVAVNVGFYAFLLFLGVGIFLGPAQILVSVPAVAVDYMQAVGMMAAFLAAVYILIEVSASDKVRLRRTRQDSSQNP